MNTTSLLIVALATIIGTIALYFGVQVSMDASDDFASDLSVSSVEYIRMREKAVAEGRDPSKIRMNAARSQKPDTYDESLSSAKTSPYIRSDSDEAKSNDSDKDGNDDEALVSNDDDNSESSTTNVSQSIASEDTESEERIEEEDGTDSAEVADKEDGEEEYVYTVSDEIRHQLATEEMSEEKRETLESVLPQKTPEPVRAIDVRMQFDSRDCVVPRNSNSWIGVMFRHESSAIRGTSLIELDDLIQLRDRCEGTLVVEDYITADSLEAAKLLETRRDEVKYYLLQRRVPKEFIQVDSL